MQRKWRDANPGYEQALLGGKFVDLLLIQLHG